MTSPDHVYSASPTSLRDTPLRRRRDSSVSDVGDLLARSRLSRSASRSFDPNDPEARERQRTMDVDMAMHLSRARRETSSMPPNLSPFNGQPDQQQKQSDEYEFPITFPLSSDEQRALDLARGERPLSYDGLNDPHAPTTRQPSPAPFLVPHLSPGQEPPLSPHICPPQSGPDVGSLSTYGLPTYQPNESRTNFDFLIMEEFAMIEKTRLGLTSPNKGSSPDLLQQQEDLFQPPPPSGASEISADIPTGSTRNARQRKLSQSVPGPRAYRKGIGGKMALFENKSGHLSYAQHARLASVLGTNLTPIASSDHLPTQGVSDPAAIPHSVAGDASSPHRGAFSMGYDRPYRFSFYSNALSATIHARSLSELPAEGQTFEDLFSGVSPPSSGGELGHKPPTSSNHSTIAPMPISANQRGRSSGETPSTTWKESNETQGAANGQSTPRIGNNNKSRNLSKTSGSGGMVNGADIESRTWWLDVLSPTDEEMKMLSKVFSIHPLTTEDIIMEETREKIELFRHYFLVCFRSFDQDPYSPTHLEPLNMYIIVFREGILSFHFRPTPHPQNVRRRIKQLKDYISVTSDWISYALIDDITDAFGPLIQNIEYEVDSIDELVLILKDTEQTDMLRRIGTCRKKVMGLLRLMGNKADVVKGLAKRCNENWRVAPTSDIGLYLSDIQDHLITMTQNLNHYEKILSRSHSNYLAQISIEMTDANNQINDVLSKLTALGTILVPMNLVTGLWGMNVHVPGEGVPGYAWFISIICVLAVFALVGGYSTYRLMIRG